MGRRAATSACQACRDRHLKCRPSDTGGGIPCRNCLKGKRECVESSWYRFKPLSRDGCLVEPLHVSRMASSSRRNVEHSTTETLAAEFQTETAEVEHAEVVPHNMHESPSTEEANLYQGRQSTSADHHQDTGLHDPETRVVPDEMQYQFSQPVRQHRVPEAGEEMILSPNDRRNANDFALSPLTMITSSTSPNSVDTLGFRPMPSRWTADDIFIYGADADSFRPPANHLGNSVVDYRPSLPRHEDNSDKTVHLSSTDAKYLQYFIQVWGPLLDATDAARHFTVSVPRIATSQSPWLLYAILTVAACQLDRIAGTRSRKPESYRQKCAQVLVPALLEDPNCLHEASIFATYVLLRVYDDLTVNLSDRKPESLFSDGLALSTKPWLAYSEQGPLKCAAFWVHLRQDIQMSLMFECPIKMDNTLYVQNVAIATKITDEDLAMRNRTAPDRQYFESQDASTTGSQQLHEGLEDPGLPQFNVPYNSAFVECAWTNRLVGLMCRVMNYCFQLQVEPQSAAAVTEWSSFLTELELWNSTKPTSFNPIYSSSQQSTPKPEQLPQIYFQNDWHLLGALYYHMIYIMLKSHKPGYIRRSDRNLDYNTRTEINYHLVAMCAAVRTNPIQQALLIIPALLNVAGRFVCHDQIFQKQILELLDLAKTTAGSPADRVVEKLKAVWISPALG